MSRRLLSCMCGIMEAHNEMTNSNIFFFFRLNIYLCGCVSFAIWKDYYILLLPWAKIPLELDLQPCPPLAGYASTRKLLIRLSHIAISLVSRKWPSISPWVVELLSPRVITNSSPRVVDIYHHTPGFELVITEKQTQALTSHRERKYLLLF